MTEPDTKTWPLSDAIETFLAEPHIATLTTFRPDNTPHVVPVSFSWDSEARLARIMVGIESRKARNLIAMPGSRVALCQAEGGRWVTLEGTATISEDPQRVAEGRQRYINRYRRQRGQQEDNRVGGPARGRAPGTREGPGPQRQRDPLDSWQAVIEIAVDRVMSRRV
ncbi:TIGR03618 family F420-dependent PPOX class oxidoreductase [Actinobacteria bacterium YIM 96077]|uniref:Pyridoxamine 5'-phosphate oxidase n=1 Tax=Phytoactinopolyspora halophila TaxID=1981511 RepID=A0A329QAS8_9ACTN|nr:TIGR03618 family F420-dependent PPOX class oxidoreductase [Phytoactinopolyspora halophila]AYY12663.1 TIGR03618 family F420-dependent PPOX class oxidoreductase [Actinobacteria bacterium YIM 96077]RAW09171.1 pyridoxamine 5'-phosphate oxidase [Phytoactinopolyspora halophila]